MEDNKKDNIVLKKSVNFAFLIIDLDKNLFRDKEFILSKQLLRSGTASGHYKEKQNMQKVGLILFINMELHNRNVMKQYTG